MSHPPAQHGVPQDADSTRVPPPIRPPVVPPPVRPPVVPAPAQAVPRVTYLPAPTGPHWGLVLTGLIFLVVAAGVVANQLSGFQVSDLTEMGPVVLIVGGLALALVGVVGILARRRR